MNISIDKLEEIISLPWDQGKSGLEAMPNTYKHFYLRYACVDMLKDAQDLLDRNAEAAQFVMFATLQAALNAYYRIQKRWSVKPKNQLDDLQQYAPDLALRVRHVLTNSLPMQERCMVLSALIDTILEPVGGRLHEWSSPLEAVDEVIK